jgi:hypothetical protein
MDALRQRPVFALDHEARKQIRETRATILEHLRTDPDDFKALVLADVIGEIDPDHDAALAAHRMRFRATRTADWTVRARELGLDRLLFHLAHGMTASKIGLPAVPILERRAVEISEARAPGVTVGKIDADAIPAGLVRDSRVTIAYHPSGHLKHVKLHIDELHRGELTLDAKPGSGHYMIVEKRGGYGTMIQEAYRDGAIVTTLNTPWHDGEESREPAAWTKWVLQNLGDLERLAGYRKRRHKQGRSAK